MKKFKENIDSIANGDINISVTDLPPTDTKTPTILLTETKIKIPTNVLTEAKVLKPPLLKLEK